MQKQNNLQIQRSELKYLISNQEYLALIARLKNILPTDANSPIGHGYFVRSLYFDSHFNKSLRDKEIGALVRKKYRLRIYDSNAANVKFEIKHKIGSQVFKETAEISKESAKRVITGDYSDLLSYNNEILNRIYVDFILGNYRPKLIVDYWREAFRLDIFNLAITIDHDIRASKFDFDFFSKKLNNVPILAAEKRVLEIKFNQVLPDYVKSILQINSFEKTNFSKYASGRDF